MKRALIVLPLLALAGCAITPEQRVNAALQKAGVPPRIAHCMAGRMAAKLSIAQLKQLKALVKSDEPDEKMNVKHALRRVAALGDPEIVSVTTRAAITCEIKG
jgi:hypothetical protein